MVAVKRKKIKIEFLLPAMLVLIGLGVGGVLVRPTANPDVTLPARIGDVPWNHELHSRMKDYTCVTCHHTDRLGVVNPRPCSDCHALPPPGMAMILADVYTGETVVNPVYKSSEQGPPAMQAYHGKCVGCHTAVKKGPTSCRDCHAQSFVGPHGEVEWSHREHSRQMAGKLACVTCHHKDTDAKQDGDYRPCRDCHQPLAEMAKDLTRDVPRHEKETHFHCAFCHATEDPEIGVSHCSECHPELEPNPPGTPDDKKVAPSLEQAIHKRCLGCHNASNPDLSPNMPGVCTDCHKYGPGSFQFEYQEAGPTVWSHTRHAELTDWSCDKCHHKDEADPQKPHLACWRCHGKDDFAGIPKLEKAVHDRCIGCHEERLAGPLTCNGCHAGKKEDQYLLKSDSEEGVAWTSHSFHAADMAFSCRDCHHNTMTRGLDPFTACTDTFECPDPAKAMDIQACSNCHVSRATRAAMGSPMPGDTLWMQHGDKASPEAGDTSAPAGGARVPPPAASSSSTGPAEDSSGTLVAPPPVPEGQIMNLEDAVHGPCLDCHTRMKAGPLKCKDCHVK